MAKQHMEKHEARCMDCEASCDKKNAQGWAHRHAESYGHNVRLSIVYSVEKSKAMRNEEA